MTRIRRLLRKLALSAVLVWLFLAVLEGSCGMVSFLYDALTVEPVLTTERAYTQYDPLLGWSSIPNTYIGDFYGPGGILQINGQGFRAAEDFTPQVPAGRVRLICSGDSFTLGFGVANDWTWCHLLSVLEPRLQTVNMGQGGYGLDQAFLWYQRDGLKLEHDIQVLAVNNIDFLRTEASQFRGYGKPVLAVRDGQLVTENVPVPRWHYVLPWLTEKLRDADQLHLFRAVRAGWRWLRPPLAPEARDAEARAVASKVLEQLEAGHRQRGSLLLVVYLPVIADYDGERSDPWREHLRAETAARGVPFLDLVEGLRRVRRGEMRRLFLRDGHYTVAGNRFVAERLLEALRGTPAVAQRLAAAAGSIPPASAEKPPAAGTPSPGTVPSH